MAGEKCKSDRFELKLVQEETIQIVCQLRLSENFIKIFTVNCDKFSNFFKIFH